MDNNPAEAASELELSELLPRALRRDTATSGESAFSGQVTRRTVAPFALAVGTLIAGNVVLAAALSAMAVAAKNSAAIGAPLSFADAFVLTLPLAVLVTGLVWFGSTRRLHPVELAAFGVVGVIGVTYLAGQVGIDSSTMGEMMASASSLGGSWFVRTFGIIGEFLTYYTWVPFLGGVITGYAMGAICVRLSSHTR